MAPAFDYSNGSAVVRDGIIYYSPNCTRPVDAGRVRFTLLIHSANPASMLHVQTTLNDVLVFFRHLNGRKKTWNVVLFVHLNARINTYGCSFLFIDADINIRSFMYPLLPLHFSLCSQLKICPFASATRMAVP